MIDRAREAIAQAEHEEWLTVKEFAARVRFSEKAIRDAIRTGRLSKQYRVERVTDGPRGALRIVVLKAA